MRQHTDASVDSSSLRDMLTGQESVFELMLGFFYISFIFTETRPNSKNGIQKVRVLKSLALWADHQTRMLAEWAEYLVITTLSFNYIKILRDPHTVLPNARDQTFNLRDIVQPFAVIVQSF